MQPPGYLADLKGTWWPKDSQGVCLRRVMVIRSGSNLAIWGCQLPNSTCGLPEETEK